MTNHWIDDLDYLLHDGVQYWMRKDNFIDKQCFRESVTEDQYRLSSLVGKIDLVIDIGACQGIFALRANALLRCPVVSLEPHPDNFQILTLNAKGAKGAIAAIQGAFAGPEKDSRLFLTTHNHEAANHLAEEGIPVLGWSGVDLFPYIPKDKTILFKFDFEGGEEDAIYQLTTLSGRRSYIAGEWHYDPEPVRRALLETGCQNIEVHGVASDITGLFFATKGI